MRRAALGALVAALATAAPAAASFTLSADSTGTRGHIQLVIFSSEPAAQVAVDERVNGRLRPIATPALVPFGTDSAGAPTYGAIVGNRVTWSCTRRTRHFIATGPGGVRGAYTARTPSCANRLVVRARPGRVTLRDSFGLGDVHARVCAPTVCRRVGLARGRTSRTVRLRVHRRERLVVRNRHQRTTLRVGRRPRGGPVILATGDSLMQNLGVVLADRLGGSAQVIGDSHPGATLISPIYGDWRDVARKQVARHHPRATVVFIGANDTGTIAGIACCSTAWEAEYERRVRTIMATYSQDGGGQVIWLTVPFARDPRRRAAITAIDAALRRAAAGIDGVTIIPVDEVLTPGGVYRGRLDGVRVREPDGIHLSLAGARLVAPLVAKALRAAHVL